MKATMISPVLSRLMNVAMLSMILISLLLRIARKARSSLLRGNINNYIFSVHFTLWFIIFHEIKSNMVIYLTHKLLSWMNEMDMDLYSYNLMMRGCFKYLSLIFIAGHQIHRRWEWKWCMQAPKIDSRENWMELESSCKQPILVKWVSML